MKKWNICNLIFNDDTLPPFSYEVSGENSEGDTVVLISSDEFVHILVQKYFSFYLLTPSFYDTENESIVELCPTIAPAITHLHSVFNYWVSDRINGFMKLYEALRGEYNPIENYNKHIESTMENKGKETTVESPTGTETETYTPTGTETDTHTKAGTEKTTETPSGTETETTTKTGTETNTHNAGVTGSHTTTLSKTPYDSSSFLDAEKTVEQPYSDNDVQSFSDRSDTKNKTFTDRKTDTELSFTNRQDTDTHSYTNRQDTTTKSFTNRKTETEKSFTNRIDEYKYHEWGNIGVTTSQQMIESQFPLTEKDTLSNYIVNLFVHENLIL